MPAEFFCGCHVVCVDDSPVGCWFNLIPSGLQVGKVYTVCGFSEAIGVYEQDCGMIPLLLLVEVINPGDPFHPDYNEGFAAGRFRPLDEDRIAWARNIAAERPLSVEAV